MTGGFEAADLDLFAFQPFAKQTPKGRAVFAGGGNGDGFGAGLLRGLALLGNGGLGAVQSGLFKV